MAKVKLRFDGFVSIAFSKPFFRTHGMVVCRKWREGGRVVRSTILPNVIGYPVVVALFFLQKIQPIGRCLVG